MRALQTLKSAPPAAMFGVVVVAAYLFVALFAPLLAPYDETEIVGRAFDPWGGEFAFGTDNLGRDMLTRMIYGARNTVGLAFLITAIAFSVGAFAGLFAAAFGGLPDQVISRVVDAVMAIPPLILALLALSVVGTSLTSLVCVISLIDATRVFRLSRAAAMDVAVMDFVEAAKLRGENVFWIARREILPNILPPLIAEFGLRFIFVFLFISALSFLGLGLQPPTADWGSMVRENSTLISYGDITPLLPAAAISLLTVAVNFIVDWMLHRASGLKDK